MADTSGRPELPELSVVIPVYGCESCLRALHVRLRGALDALGLSHEIIFIDDRSTDGGWDTVQAIAAQDWSVRAFRLSRNFGQPAAITAGLAKSRGRWTIVMDCDLQDPPEVIPRLVEKAKQGFDVVFGVRRRSGTPALRRLAAAVRARILMLLADVEIDTGHGAMSLMSRRVVGAYLSVPDRDRDHRLILYWLGFDTASVEYTQAKRHSGSSSYSLSRLLGLAVAGLFFQTTRLLRWIVYAGFLLALGGAVLGVYLVVDRLFEVSPVPGWTSLAVFILIFGGFIILSTGVTGLYIGRVFDQVKGRPLYVIQDAVEQPSIDPQDELRPEATGQRPPARSR